MDRVADMLTTINNAQIVSKKQISVPYSEFKFRIAELLQKEGYVLNVEKKGRVPNKKIIIDLKYKENGTPMITKIKKISKQGQRIYKTSSEIKPVKSGYGLSIISTSKGVVTNKEARKNNVGGEIICEVW
ncbi:MAG TPA: 30S ribosomal protein S8 [Candidatus Pacearchaeota archaeon]|nr:30S ribosomal protein S8 [Candidatus Pacearchaeota archaeon]